MNSNKSPMNYHSSTDAELWSFGIDRADYDGEIITAELPGKTVWYVAKADGTFWAVAYNEDEIFTDRESCHAWLDSRIN
jgi:hypothetical protein